MRNERNTGPTLGDVAARVGVGKAAVSAALNGTSAGTRVSEDTRRRILAAAEELNYHPNLVARSLRHRATNSIGFYAGEWAHYLRKPFFAEVISGLEQGCAAAKKDLLIHASFNGRSVDEIYAELVGGQINGLVLFTPEDDLLKKKLSTSRLPVVVIANAVSTLPSVVVDDRAGSELLAKHLAERGHRHVFYVAISKWITMTLSERRENSFFQTAQALHMRVTKVDDPLDSEGYDALLNRIAATPVPDRPTAVVCWYDDTAQVLLDRCIVRGVRMPQELAIAGFDGVYSTVRPARFLTTIRAPWSDVARTALSLLIERTQGREVALETVLPVELAIGDTT